MTVDNALVFVVAGLGLPILIVCGVALAILRSHFHE